MSRRACLLLVLGLSSLLPYLAALGLGDLRRETPGFEVAFFGAFGLYLAACALVLRAPAEASPRHQAWVLGVTFMFAILFRAILLPTRPTLSDDMYRYVWDGRVQAYGINPYRYPPDAHELTELHQSPVDADLWRFINRQASVTVYPPGAQLAFAAFWRLVGDSVLGFKVALVVAELLGAAMLLGLLRALNLPLERALIYLWSPLLVFEVAQAGHVDGLLLPILVAAFWARVAGRTWLLGALLGLGVLVKLIPLLLLPALIPFARPFNWRGLRPAAQMLSAFVGVIALGYLPYMLWAAQAGGGAASVLGYLPHYLGENFNLGLARWLFDLAGQWNVPREVLTNAVTLGGLAAIGLVCLLRPVASPIAARGAGGREALLRCTWFIGWFTLTTQNLFPWYLLWLLPLLAALLEPGPFLGFKLSAAAAWLMFTGLVALSYTFFIEWRVVLWAQAAEFWPLYALLLAAALARFVKQNRKTAYERLAAAP